jgi:hypothetical protein
MDWIHLAWDSFQWLILINIAEVRVVPLLN